MALTSIRSIIIPRSHDGFFYSRLQVFEIRGAVDRRHPAAELQLQAGLRQRLLRRAELRIRHETRIRDLDQHQKSGLTMRQTRTCIFRFLTFSITAQLTLIHSFATLTNCGVVK